MSFLIHSSSLSAPGNMSPLHKYFSIQGSRNFASFNWLRIVDDLVSSCCLLLIVVGWHCLIIFRGAKRLLSVFAWMKQLHRRRVDGIILSQRFRNLVRAVTSTAKSKPTTQQLDYCIHRSSSFMFNLLPHSKTRDSSPWEYWPSYIAYYG